MIADALASLLGIQSSVNFLDPRDPAIAKILGLGQNTKSGVRVDGETVLGIPAVLRGVNILSNALMKVRPIIYKRVPPGGDDKERDREHPSWRCVTRRANDLMSAGYFRKTLTSWCVHRGNGLGHIERDGGGRVIEMLPLLPDRSGMAIFRAGQRMSGEADVQPGDKVRYWTMVGGECRQLLPENVIHIKSLSSNGYWGLDLTLLMKESLGGCIAARDFSASFYGQGAMGSGIVFMPAGLKDKQQDEFVERVKKGSEGLSRAHRLMILEETAKYQQLTIDPEKASLIATMQAQRIDVANLIGIQAHKVGDSSRVAYNSLEQSNQEHLDDDLDPLLQVWEDELEDKCLSEDEKSGDTHLIEFNRKSLVRVNLAARTARHQFERQNGMKTANQILRQENESPIGEVGDTYMVPANMTILSPEGLPILRGQVAPEPATRPAAPPDDDGAEEKPDRGAFNELALHEVDGVVRRACNEAREAAGDPGKFVEFLSTISGEPEWATRPPVISALLVETLHCVHAELDAFTRPPHSAKDLKTNVLGAVDRIRATAIVAAKTKLEAVA